MRSNVLQYFVSSILLQALIFGMLHGGMLYLLSEVTPTLSLFLILLLVPGFIGYILGILKEKVGNGSIIPGWWAHGMGNFFAYTAVIFFT